MSTAALIGFLVAAAVLVLWAPPPLSRLDPASSPLPGWVVKAWQWVLRQRSGRRKADQAVVRELPEALDLLAICLEAGAPMSQAIATVAGVSLLRQARSCAPSMRSCGLAETHRRRGAVSLTTPIGGRRPATPPARPALAPAWSKASASTPTRHGAVVVSRRPNGPGRWG